MWIFGLASCFLLLGYCSYVYGETEGWSDWSLCSVTCGNGTRNRTRECINGRRNDNTTCDGDEIELQECNITVCSDTVDDSGTGNIIIGVVVGVILCILIIISIIITRHGRCWNRSHKHFDPHKLKEERKPSTYGDEVDNRLEHENQNNFEPSFITEVATDTGEKFVYIDLSQVYYKEKPMTCNVEAVIENEARDKDEDQSSLHYEHRNGEIVNNPIFDEPSDIKSSVNMNGKNGLFKHTDIEIEPVVDNHDLIDDGDVDTELDSVRSVLDTETEVSDSEIGIDTDSSASELSDTNTVKLNEAIGIDTVSNVSELSETNTVILNEKLNDADLDIDLNAIENSVPHCDDDKINDDDIVNKDVNEAVESDIESIKEEVNSIFFDPFDALDLMQRASPYLFGEENDAQVSEIPIIDDVIMEDIHEDDEEYLTESEVDSEYDYEACSDNDEYETETECPSYDGDNDESDVSDETVKESDDESDREVEKITSLADDCDDENNNVNNRRIHTNAFV